jgi:hypothetical protein
MTRKEIPTPARVVDYSSARARAIRWLGDRYLLARPINGARYGSRPPAPAILAPSGGADAAVLHTDH